MQCLSDQYVEISFSLLWLKPSSRGIFCSTATSCWNMRIMIQHYNGWQTLPWNLAIWRNQTPWGRLEEANKIWKAGLLQFSMCMSMVLSINCRVQYASNLAVSSFVLLKRGARALRIRIFKLNLSIWLSNKMLPWLLTYWNPIPGYLFSLMGIGLFENSKGQGHWAFM